MFCYCFSSCTKNTTTEFLQSIPRFVESQSSPWYAYLRSVYLVDVPLPFDLSELNFFYHHDSYWDSVHPETEWPMPTCNFSHVYTPWDTTPTEGILSTRMAWYNDPQFFKSPKDPVTVGSACDWLLCSKLCSPWLIGGEGTRGSLRREITGMHVLLNTESRTSRGVVIFEPPKALNTMTRLKDMRHGRLQRWIEVVRVEAVTETHIGQGCWFCPVRGSGMWIKVNGSISHLKNKGSTSGLVNRWLSLRNLSNRGIGRNGPALNCDHK